MKDKLIIHGNLHDFVNMKALIKMQANNESKHFYNYNEKNNNKKYVKKLTYKKSK